MEIAKEVRIRGLQQKEADAFSLVYEWLRNPANGTWVMIIDNADDKDVFTSRPASHRQSEHGKQIHEFLPQSPNGAIVVTSRSRNAAFQVTYNYKHILAVDPMGESEAISLLRCQLVGSHTDADMKLLVETLDCVPLAISQAAAYISRRSLAIHDYLRELSDGNEASPGPLDESLPQGRRDSKRSNSIVATWNITFEYVRKTSPQAARLLSLMCFFDRQDIPEALLQEQYEEEVNTSLQKPQRVWWRRRPRTWRKGMVPPTATQPSSTFEDDWLLLHDLSLIKLNRDRHHFSMHSLVQFITKRWLVSHGELDKWSNRFVTIINNSCPGPYDRNIYESLRAHAYAALPYRPRNVDLLPLQSWAALTRKMAHYYADLSVFDIAQKLYGAAAQAFDVALGPGAPEALNCHTQSAQTLTLIDRYEDAERVLRRVLHKKQETLGPTHPDTRFTVDHIGRTLVSQGHNAAAAAEALHMSTLDTCLRTLGPAHKDTQSCFETCGFFLTTRGRYDDAYKAYRQAYKARHEEYPAVYDSTWAHCLHGLGLSALIHNRPAEAEPYLREGIAEIEKQPSDRDYIDTIGLLADSLSLQDKHEEAEPVLRRVFEWYETQSNLGHPCQQLQAEPEKNEDRFIAALKLTSALSKLHRFDEAEPLARDCLSERMEQVGAQHEATLLIIYLLAGILAQQGNHDEALELSKSAYKSSQAMLGEQCVEIKDRIRQYREDFEKIMATEGGDAIVSEAVTASTGESSELDIKCGMEKVTEMVADSGTAAVVSHIPLDLENDDTGAGAETERNLVTA
jgi:tetratricopeptide (TPR) repeat protein